VDRLAELHCHLDGVLDAALAAELGLDVELPAVRTLADWEAYSACVAQIPHRDRWLPRVLDHHVARLRAQPVRYAELFVSGVLFARDDEAWLVEYFAELRARAMAAAGPDLEIQLVICIGRGTPERLARQTPRIAALRRAGLVTGVALAGDETHPVQPLQRSLDELRALGLGIEIHAGELAGANSVRDALRYGAPDRLGHGLAAFGDPALLDEIGERGIHLELCPSSNLALGAVRHLEQHPIGRAKELGLSFSINTDDPGAFGCTLASEVAAVAAAFGWSRGDLDQIYDNTLRAAFR
jgi:adenosine deaminase